MKNFREFLDKEGITEIDFEDRKVYEFMIDVVKRYEDEKVKLILPVVSQQRELLIDFIDKWNVKNIDWESTWIDNEDIDEYIKGNL